jgi:hypothetical protein
VPVQVSQQADLGGVVDDLVEHVQREVESIGRRVRPPRRSQGLSPSRLVSAAEPARQRP